MGHYQVSRLMVSGVQNKQWHILKVYVLVTALLRDLGFHHVHGQESFITLYSSGGYTFSRKNNCNNNFVAVQTLSNIPTIKHQSKLTFPLSAYTNMFLVFLAFVSW